MPERWIVEAPALGQRWIVSNPEAVLVIRDTLPVAAVLSVRRLGLTAAPEAA